MISNRWPCLPQTFPTPLNALHLRSLAMYVSFPLFWQHTFILFQPGTSRSDHECIFDITIYVTGLYRITGHICHFPASNQQLAQKAPSWLFWNCPPSAATSFAHSHPPKQTLSNASLSKHTTSPSSALRRLPPCCQQQFLYVSVLFSHAFLLWLPLLSQQLWTITAGCCHLPQLSLTKASVRWRTPKNSPSWGRVHLPDADVINFHFLFFLNCVSVFVKKGRFPTDLVLDLKMPLHIPLLCVQLGCLSVLSLSSAKKTFPYCYIHIWPYLAGCIIYALYIHCGVLYIVMTAYNSTCDPIFIIKGHIWNCHFCRWPIYVFSHVFE